MMGKALHAAATGAFPEFLRLLAAGPRVTIRRDSTPLKGGKCIVYWMQRAQRGLDNPAVDVAVTIGNELKLPVVVYFSVISDYPNANLRHYAFLNQGLADIAQDLADRNIAFVDATPTDTAASRGPSAACTIAHGSIALFSERCATCPMHRLGKSSTHERTFARFPASADFPALSSKQK